MLDLTLILKVGDKVKIKLIPHECKLCQSIITSRKPEHYERWRVDSIGAVFIILARRGIYHSTSVNMTVRFDIEGKGLGSKVNFIIYKVNGRRIRSEDV